jgi:hypothetical protein
MIKLIKLKYYKNNYNINRINKVDYKHNHMTVQDNNLHNK